MRRASVLLATLLALAPPALAQAAETEVRLGGPTRATVPEEGASLALTVALSLTGVACPEGGTATVRLRVASAEGYEASLSDDAVVFALPRGDWTARAYSASAPVDLLVQGAAAAGSARVVARIGPDDVAGCVETLGVEDASSEHDVSLTSAASRPPPPPAFPAEEPPASPEEATGGEPSRTRSITLRDEPLPGPVVMLLAVAAAGSVAIVVQRIRAARAA